MQTEFVRRKQRFHRVRIAWGMLGALGVGITGCGGGSSSSGPGPDRSADFAIIVDPTSANTILQPGKTTPITLDLVSANGFAQPVTLSADGTPYGFNVTPASTTVPSLPKGTTKIIVNVPIPADNEPVPARVIANVSATGGGISRPLNSGIFNDGSGIMKLAIGGFALSVATKTPFYTPFLEDPFDTSHLTGRVPFVSVGHPGPITVTLTNPNPNVTATLTTSTFTPSGAANSLEANIPLDLHADPTLPGGTYPFTLTATAADGAKLISTVNLFITSVAFVGTPPTLSVKGGTSTASADADLTITGPPGLPVSLGLTSPAQNIQLTVTPSTATIPASGTLTQHITLAVNLPFFTPSATYSIPLTVGGGSRLSQPATFTLKTP